MTVIADATRRAPPLSIAQEGPWYLSLIGAGRTAYNETVSIRKEGPFDARAFRYAFNQIVRRHEAWRTIFEMVDRRPVQIARPAPSFELPLVDLSGGSVAEAERRAVELISSVSSVPYDLRQGPLLRPRLVKFPGDSHRLYLAMHHLVFDGVSLIRIVLPELIALYDAARVGEASPLPEPQAQYADFARWEQKWVTEPRFARRLSYWRRRLELLPATSLPLDHPRPEVPRFRGAALGLSVAPEVVTQLHDVGKSVGATFFQVLAATWSLQLGRCCGERDIVFAAAADARQRPEFESVVGYCLTPLVLRVDLGGDPSFTELIVRVRNELLDGLDHLVPFVRLVRELHRSGYAAGNPVYQTMIVLEPPIVSTDPSWSLIQTESEIADAVGTSKLDLELQLDERPDGVLTGQLIYDRDLFERATAASMLEHWLKLLGAVVDDPAAPISSLPN